MKISSLKLFLFSIIFIFAGCSVFKSTGDSKKFVVGEVGGEPITYQDMRASFFAAPPLENEDYNERDEFLEFLDLYLDYRTKVRAARDAGYFEKDEILTELNQYEMQSVFPYWLEMRFRDEMLDELVERSKLEIHTSHILITVAENASPADTLRAWNRLMEAREKFLTGEDTFENLMDEYSTRQGGRSVGGDLGFITAGWAIKPFEDVVYTTSEGEISMPFRTSFGYHVLKVHEIRDRQPERSYSHIYFRTRGQGFSLVTAQERSQSAHSKLLDGTAWNEVVMEYTDDPDSRSRGGDIGWLDPNRFQPQFVAGLQVLSEQGEFSQPFESEYGIHIVRLDSIRTYRDEAHLREELYERLRSLPRYRENRKYTIENVRRTARDSVFVSSYEAFVSFYKENSDTKFSEIQFPSTLLDLPFYRIDGRVFAVETYKNFVGERLEHTAGNAYHHGLLNDYKERKVNQVIIPVTKREFPEFADLSRRYLEGLAVFKITEDSVWTYAMTDSLRLRELFEENKERYWFDRRYRYYRVTADSDSILENAMEVVKSGVPVDSIRAHVSGLILRTDIINSLADFPFNHLDGLEPGDFSEIFTFRNRPTVLFLSEILEPRQMTFDEAFMRVVSDYQPIREEEWMSRLREYYAVQGFRERLEHLLDTN